jgi:hypothetical protein
VNFTSFRRAFDLFRRTWQSPSNAHAYRLYIFNEPGAEFSVSLPSFAVFAAISEALYSNSFLKDLSTFFVSADFAALLFRLPIRFAAFSAEP